MRQNKIVPRETIYYFHISCILKNNFFTEKKVRIFMLKQLQFGFLITCQV